MSRASFCLRLFGAASLVTVAALGLVNCASEGAATPNGSFDAGAPDAGDASAMRCRTIRDCEQHNHVCVGATQTREGTCAPPQAECDTSLPQEDQAARCYPDARCQAVPRMGPVSSSRGGLCSFQAPAQPVFRVTQPKIELTHPTAATVLRSSDGVSLRWMQGNVPADAVTVAVVMTQVPALDGNANRLAHREAIFWIWSSAESTGPVMAGAVPLQYGRAGVTREGALGPEYGRNNLPDGRYWWFVYAIRDGRVVSASDVQPFRVGADFMINRACSDDTQCAMAGELPETVACVGGVCRRRCASNFDCAALGGSCDLNRDFGVREVDGGPPRRGAFCVGFTGPDAGG